jgi:hypothetical protein
METFGIARDSAHHNFAGLAKLGLLLRKGSGRAAQHMSTKIEY